jgi:diguanylate cyclase
MNTTALYIVAGTLLGVAQLAFGVAIGLWIRRPGRASGDACQLDEQRAREFLGRLETLTSGLNRDVQGHQAQLSKINHRLNAAPHLQAKSQRESRKDGKDQPTSLTELVVGVVGEVLRANQQLQERLSSAETQLQQQSAEIASHLSRSLTDDLTGLPNRRAFDDQLRQRLEGYARYAVPFSLLLIDIDYFKKVNDTHGHVAGDRVLSSIATVLRGAMRKPDIVARYGGEEFAAILPYTSLEDAVHAACHARLAVEGATTLFEGVSIRVTASVGLSSIQDGDDWTAILKRADDALYASKSGGRNCGHLHDGVKCVRIISDSTFTSDNRPREKDEPIPAAAATTEGPRARLSLPVDHWSAPLSPELEAACADLRGIAAERSR